MASSALALSSSSASPVERCTVDDVLSGMDVDSVGSSVEGCVFGRDHSRDDNLVFLLSNDSFEEELSGEHTAGFFGAVKVTRVLFVDFSSSFASRLVIWDVWRRERSGGGVAEDHSLALLLLVLALERVAFGDFASFALLLQEQQTSLRDVAILRVCGAEILVTAERRISGLLFKLLIPGRLRFFVSAIDLK